MSEPMSDHVRPFARLVLLWMIPPSPPWPGLSHISKEFVEVSPAQPCEVHFASDRSFIWVGTQDVERDATDQREVLWCVVFACSGCVLIEADVQVPMQLILDAPMRTHQLEQPLRRQDRRQGH